MSDLIRRQDAIDLIENESRKWGDEYGVSDVLCDLADLPSAQPEQRWIPVPDRLPEIDMTFPHSERYLVQYEDGDMDVASWSNVNWFWTDHVTEPYWNCVQFQTVTAWMPLPKPWKGEANEHDQ